MISWRGNGSPLQHSCLENPLNRGAWQAMVHKAAKSRTQLKQLSTQHQETVEDGGAWCVTVHGVSKSQTQLSNWTTMPFMIIQYVALSHWLLSLTNTHLNFLHVFSWSNSWIIFHCLLYDHLLLLSSTQGHFSCFQVWALWIHTYNSWINIINNYEQSCSGFMDISIQLL